MVNGIYEMCLSVNVSSDNHETTLFVYNRIKKLCEAFNYCTKFDESKSARKGDVLSRNIQIRIEEYPGVIITFREAIRHICFHYNLRVCKVEFTDHESHPSGSRRNFPNL